VRVSDVFVPTEHTSRFGDFYPGPLYAVWFFRIHTATQHSLMQIVHYQPMGEYWFTRHLPDGPTVDIRRAII